jgi:hypothetical protein
MRIEHPRLILWLLALTIYFSAPHWMVPAHAQGAERVKDLARF